MSLLKACHGCLFLCALLFSLGTAALSSSTDCHVRPRSARTALLANLFAHTSSTPIVDVPLFGLSNPLHFSELLVQCMLPLTSHVSQTKTL